MGINTDLNIEPYFDDFDEAKQFNRVLFRPARAVQARELTQLQTILQNQIERFGSNVYQEGTVIQGCNITTDNSLYFVKLNDSASLTDATVYRPSTEDGITTSYTIVGETNDVEAEIVFATNGFQTQDPDLKTFYIHYLSTTNVGGTDVKEFGKGETLSVRDANGLEVASVTVASVNNHTGRSFGINVSEGIIYQKGHFIFVEDQFTIVEKYAATPNTNNRISVGYNVTEEIINAGQDETLYDNAQGFNNYNAPGADRLSLKPILTTYTEITEPEDFFALVRYERGLPINIREVTEFNSIAKTMARRTYEESGNYVVSGLNTSLELHPDANDDIVPYAVISPGKAYVEGFEFKNNAKRFFKVDPSSETFTETSQSFGVQYGGFYKFEADAGIQAVRFDLEGNTRYKVYTSSNTEIGTCYVRNIEITDETITGVTVGRLYVSGMNLVAPGTPAKIGESPTTSVLLFSSEIYQQSKTGLIFDTGNDNIKTVSNIDYYRRKSTSIPAPSSGALTTFSIPNAEASDNTVVIAENNVILEHTATLNGSDLQITVTGATSGLGATVYYDDRDTTSANADTLIQVDTFVVTQVIDGKASLGVPNAIDLITVYDSTDTDLSGNDITGKFKLVRNQKDNYYDISYLSLKAGETAPVGSFLVKFTALRRESAFSGGNGYLTANSYANVNTELLSTFTGRDGTIYSLPASVDFRPYRFSSQSGYATDPSGAPAVSGFPATLSLRPHLVPSNNRPMTGDQEILLSRFDNIIVDASGKMDVQKGSPAENPNAPAVPNGAYAISQIFVPGSTEPKIKGSNPIQVKSVSTKNYTMEDIDRINRKVDRLTDAVTLSLLEADANNLLITGADGLPRFKNGILVEGMRDFDIADITNEDYNAAIDKTYTVATPAIRQFPIDLTADLTSGNSDSAQRWNETVTIATTGQNVAIVTQPYATNYRNATSNKYKFDGQMQLFPEFDSGYDVIRNPDVNIDIDIATPILDLVDNIQQFVPLTRSSSVTQVTGRSRQRVAGGTRVTTSSRTTTTTNTLINTVDTTTQRVGDFVTDIQFRPYIESRRLRFLVTGLRPNTRHYAFFSETPVSDFVQPGGIIARGGRFWNAARVRARGPRGAELRTNSRGQLYGIFNIPPGRFFIGENKLVLADVDQFGSIESAATSKAKGIYRAYNFDVGKTELTTTTRTVNFEVETEVSTTNNTSTRFIPDPPPPPRDDGNDGDGGGDGPSCFVAGTLVTMADGSKKKIEEVEIGEKLLGQDGSINKVLDFDHPMLNHRALIGINGMGPFMTPEHPVFTSGGWKAYDINDTLTAYPHLESIMQANLEIGDEILMEDGSYTVVESIDYHANEEEQRVYNFILDGTNTYHANGMLVHNRDPLSQTFYVKPAMAEDASTLFIREVDLYFKGRSATDTTMEDITTNGVTIQLREVVNGYPSSTILPFAKKHMQPSEVNVSENGTVATTVTFDDPIRLSTDKEYSIVIEPDAYDPSYLVFTSKVGGVDLASELRVTQDWGEGVLFSSTNNRAWQSYQDEDIKFSLKRVEFQSKPSDTPAYVKLVANNADFLNVQTETGASSVSGKFEVSEIAYAVESDVSYACGVSDNTATVAGTTPINLGIQEDDFVRITQAGNTFVSRVVSVVNQSGNSVITLDEFTQESLVEGSADEAIIDLLKGGYVSYYDPRKADVIHLSESSVREARVFEAGDIIIGAESGAQATVREVFNAPMSYLQPMLFTALSAKSNTTLEIQTDGDTDTWTSIAQGDTSWLTQKEYTITSKSNAIQNGEAQQFALRLNMSNSGFTATSPILDEQLSKAFAYQYEISNVVGKTSSYVSKQVILQDDKPALGLRVLSAMFRPRGASVHVQAKFTYTDDAENQSDWIELTNLTPELYSTASNITDYREHEFELDEDTYPKEFTSFQLRILMKWDDDQQGYNVYPHIYDYRAIALT